MMSTTTNPWLMLPPTFDRRRGGMVYNFYSPADEEVVQINKYGPGRDPPVFPDDNAKVVGSSHGWLALMNWHNNDLFLSNPITRRHIKLPPIQSLPNPEINLIRGSGKAMVSKLILSSSPDDEGCRAMMSFGQDDRLAFCCPGHSQEWVPIGEPYMDQDHTTYNYCYPKSYDDFVFSSKSNVFTCITKSDLHTWGMEDWDLTDMDSPKLAWIRNRGDMCDDDEAEFWREEHLAYAEQTDELFLVSRCIDKVDKETYVLKPFRVGKYGNGWMKAYPAENKGKVGLGNLALFVGTNHAFAISHFHPNSIYFANHKRYQQQPDVGIYDDDPDLSYCYYYYPSQTNTNTNVPPPIWFTPTLN